MRLPSSDRMESPVTNGIGEDEISDVDEAPPGGGDSISPCTTPLGATELEYDNYDGQFDFVGSKFEQNVSSNSRNLFVFNLSHTGAYECLFVEWVTKVTYG